MIEFSPNENDDNDFIALIERIVRIQVEETQPEEVFIIKVNHWFDFKWLSFSHKALGALGVWNEDLRLPPFIPDRIIEESKFEKPGNCYNRIKTKPLHKYQESENNRHQKINLISKSSIFVWFSGATKQNSQGSLMFYTVSKNVQKAWYVSFIKKSLWQLYKTKNISKTEVKSLMQ